MPSQANVNSQVYLFNQGDYDYIAVFGDFLGLYHVKNWWHLP